MRLLKRWRSSLPVPNSISMYIIFCYGQLIKYNVYLDCLEIIYLDPMIYMCMCLVTILNGNKVQAYIGLPSKYHLLHATLIYSDLIPGSSLGKRNINTVNTAARTPLITNPNHQAPTQLGWSGVSPLQTNIKSIIVSSDMRVHDAPFRALTFVADSPVIDIHARRRTRTVCTQDFEQGKCFAQECKLLQKEYRIAVIAISDSVSIFICYNTVQPPMIFGQPD